MLDLVMTLPIPVVILFWLGVGCRVGESNSTSDATADAMVLSDAGVDCDPALTYATFGSAFFSSYCNSCHSFTQSFAQSDGTQLSSAVQDDAMPPRGSTSLTTSEREEFSAWIACGAP